MEKEKNMNGELLKKAKDAESAEEIIALGKANGFDLSLSGAEDIYARLHKSGAVDDDDLSSVSGGACRGDGGESIPGFSDGETVSWNAAMMHCANDGNAKGVIINHRFATEPSAQNGYYVYPGSVLYIVKCSKCGSLMEVPEAWL